MWNGFPFRPLAAALALAAAATGAAADDVVPLTLEDAIARALEHNRQLVKGALDLQGYRLAADRARETARGLRIVPEGSAGAGSDSETARAGLGAEATGAYGTRVAVAAAVQQIDVDEAPTRRRGEVRLEIDQPLFRNFGPLVHDEPIVVANETLLAARRTWERDRSALAVSVAELFENLIYLRHQIAGDEAFAERLERLYALADARERQGRATRTEVLRMDLQRGEAALRLETERAQLAVQFQEFAELLGLPLDTSFRLAPPDLLDLGESDPERALAVALDERPDVAQALQDVATADRQALLARRNLLPDLRLTARQTTFGEGADWSDAGRFDQDDWFVGLVADVDLNLRGARLDVARAELDAEARRQVADIVRNRLALEVNSAWSAYRRTRAALDLAARNRELAANRAELARALFAAGRASADSVSDAEADGRAAELGELGARRDASIAAYRLLHALGTLVPAPREILSEETNHAKNDD